MDEAGAPNWAAVAAVSHSANPLPDYITLKYSTISEEEEEGGSLLSSLRKLTVCSTQCRRKRGANSVAVNPGTRCRKEWSLEFALWSGIFWGLH